MKVDQVETYYGTARIDQAHRHLPFTPAALIGAKWFPCSSVHCHHHHHHHHHHHQSLNREGRWGTTNDFATSFLHFPLFSTALWGLPNSRPVHSLMLFSHLPRSGELRTQKLKSHLVRTQSLNVLPLKPGVGQYIAIHATLTVRDFFLSCLFLHLRSIRLHFFQNLSRFFPVLAVANTWFLCRPAE